MNLPNRLTLVRIALIPVCILFLLPGWNVPAFIVFVSACLTDFLDGHIARKHHLVTNFGKFADPVADKILVLSVMVVLLSQGRFPWWALLLVVVRELAVDGLRLVAVEQGVVIAAGNLGKAKTVLQMLGVMAAMLSFPHWLVVALCAALSVMTVLSGAQYFRGAKGLLNAK